MKPGPGVSVRWGAGGKGASALRRPTGLRGRLPRTNMSSAGAGAGAGGGRQGDLCPFLVPHIPPNPVQLLVLCPRLWKSKLGH